MITYEEWVVEDVTASAYEEPLGAEEEVLLNIICIFLFFPDNPSLFPAGPFAWTTSPKKTQKCVEENNKAKI